MKAVLAPAGVVTTTGTGPVAVSSGGCTFTCVGDMYSTTAGLLFTVTDVPSSDVGSLPLTISVDVFHMRSEPAGARLVPKIATHEPVAMEFVKLASFTTPVTVGRLPPPPVLGVSCRLV